MKKILFLIFLPVLFACENEKIIQLPEINHSEISDITDVSAAYLFYDETQTDSVELNRRNLISTTNWLINVDKRLTLKQAIPQIKFLQEKKGKSSHKNEKAKNYFTCHDTSINNLGFIEFTDAVYYNNLITNLIADELNKENKSIILYFNTINDIKINAFNKNASTSISHTNASQLVIDILAILEKQESKTNFILCFNKNLTFQVYISFKSILSKLATQPILISNTEFLSD
jgi:hypothetical protein